MFEKVPVPAKGERLRAAWGAGVSNRINELCQMGPSHMLVRGGVTGTGFAPLPANLRDRRGGSTVLHPWKVIGLKSGGNEDNTFKIYSPLGETYGRSLFIGGTHVPVDGLTARDDGYWSFDGEDDIGSEPVTLYIVAYLTPDGEAGDDDPQDYKFAAEMVLDPETFAEESKVSAVYEIIPVADVHVETDDDLAESGVVDMQRLKDDVIHPVEYYI